MGLDIKRVAMVGAGTMGRGIAQVFARAGLEVTLIDAAPEQLEEATGALRSAVERDVRRRRLSAEEGETLLGRVTTSTELEPAGEVQFVLEAIFEDAQAKGELLRRLNRLCPPEVIFASNTSSLSITALAASSGRPDRVVGMHFFNPAPAMKLVEVTRGLTTSEEAHLAAVELAHRLGKTPVVVQDSPGFIVNRLLIPMLNEAAYLVMEGVASEEDIDSAMRLGANHPMGPLALADLIGLDICLHIMEALERELGDPKYRPCPLLRRMVAAGLLGRKSGRGFYEY
jgi:3-hydroxybutyryl-CoA dehydrogenase